MFLLDSAEKINLCKISAKNKARKQAAAELGQAQLQLKLELSFTKFKICCIKLYNKNTIS